MKNLQIREMWGKEGLFLRVPIFTEGEKRLLGGNRQSWFGLLAPEP